jgi:hypothetical protein
MTETSVLIAEHDALWLPWARAARKPQHQLVLLVQHAQESQSDFFSRVCERLEQLCRQVGWLKQIVVLPGARWDGPSLLARASTLRALLTKLRRRGSRPTRVVLDGGDKEGPAAIGVQAIADALTQCALVAPGQLRLTSGVPAMAS